MQEKVPIPLWMQGLAAVAALVIILSGAVFAYGELTSQVQNDHDLIVAISDDIDEVKEELRRLEATIVEDLHKAELDRTELRSRIQYLERILNGEQ